MSIWNLGSINADHFYRLDRLPEPGETLASKSFSTGLGGKGTNMSVAAARAAGRIHHIGAVGQDGIWARDRLMEYGVDTRFIDTVDAATGHAIILVADDGENSIVLHPGANAAIPDDLIGRALAEASPADILLMQNETNGQLTAARMAEALGLRLAYAAAPFEAEAVKATLDRIDLLILNEVEAAQLTDALGRSLADLNIADIVVTKGADGCAHLTAGTETNHPALKVTPVDTTGAGDTFTGYLIAGIDRGLPIAQAIGQATRAAALMVQREGTADVIPDLKEVQDMAL
ncbi:ribokinase [Aestuariibius sp. 2305UL40-4]|uniref:ribokinase n=1 Tax=Aestuariibius violaceus TaxID=3234132 RepID=UPI00345E1492